MKPLRHIQSKLILAFVVVALFLLGTSLYGNWSTSQALEEATLDTSHHQLEIMATDISSTLTALGNETIYLSQLESLRYLLGVQPDQAALSSGYSAGYACLSF